MQKISSLDCNLIKQLCAKLNIKLQEKKQKNAYNPILYTPDHGLISKSFVNKIYSSKRYKLHQNKPVQKKQSDHLFTNQGIIHTNPRKFSINFNFLGTPNGLRSPNFQKCQYSPKKMISKKLNQLKTNFIGQNLMTVEHVKENQNFQSPKKFGKSMRAKSANFSYKTIKSSPDQNTSRKSSENWPKYTIKSLQKQQVKGWQIQLDANEFHGSQIRVHTCF